MLTENIYVNRKGLNLSKIIKSWTFIYKCPECDNTHIITSANIEDYIDSDPHDPLQDYLICPVCEHSVGLFNGAKGKSQGFESKLWADGTYVYLDVLGESYRVL